MSLLGQLEEAVRWCKDEQAKLHVNINLHHEIIKSLTAQTRGASLDLDGALKEEDVAPPRETEEMELVERALKEALRIRSGVPSEGPRSGHGPPRPGIGPGDPAAVKPSGANRLSGARRGRPAAAASSKSGSRAPRETRKPGTAPSSRSGARSKSVNRPAAHTGAGAGGAVGTHPEVRREKHTRAGGNPGDRGRAPAAGTGPEREGPLQRAGPPVEVERASNAGTSSTPAQNRIPSDLTVKWKSLRMKQNRLWDRAVFLQSQAVPERSAFMEKMTAPSWVTPSGSLDPFLQFPGTWPRGSPDQTRALVGRLTRQGQDLSHCYKVQKLLAKHGSSPSSQPDSAELQGEAGVSLERLVCEAESLRGHAAQVKREWEAWDRCRPEGGCLCPDGQGRASRGPLLLPPVVTVATETELVELETLRLRVVLLQQEVHLQQALSESLSPQLRSLLGGDGPADPSVLRDVYSLLAEGGERFPALVLDTEPD